MKNGFSPADIFIRSVKLWWVVVIFSIAGGGLSYVIHGLLPPVFSSRVIITTSINFAKTGPLTDEKQDQAINAARDVILSNTVKEAVLSQALDQGFEFNLEEFENAHFSDRMGFDIVIGIEANDPNMAAFITNIWADTALTNLNDDLWHAIKAEALSKVLNNLEACFEEVSVTPPSSAICQEMSISEILETINQTSSLLAQETAASKAIIPSLSFALGNKAEIPVIPTYRNRNLMVFSGLMIGFIAGIIFSQISPPNRNPRKK